MFIKPITREVAVPAAKVFHAQHKCKLIANSVRMQSTPSFLSRIVLAASLVSEGELLRDTLLEFLACFSGSATESPAAV